MAYGEQRSARQRAGLQPLLAAWRAQRDARRVDLVAALGSEALRRVHRRLRDVRRDAGASPRSPSRRTPRGSCGNRMPATIWGAYQAVWAFDGDVGTADLATLHELRIAAKWLRYTLEFVREPLEPQATALIRPVVALQDHLGDQHDQHVAAAARPRVRGIHHPDRRRRRRRSRGSSGISIEASSGWADRSARRGDPSSPRATGAAWAGRSPGSEPRDDATEHAGQAGGLPFTQHRRSTG